MPIFLWLFQVVQDFVQMTEDEETPQEWLHRIMDTSSREASDYDINLLGQCMGSGSIPRPLPFFACNIEKSGVAW